MADHHGPINVNVNVSQSQSQTRSQHNTNNGRSGCLTVFGFLILVGIIGKAFEASPVLGGLIVTVIVVAVAWGLLARYNAEQEEKRAEAAKAAAAAKAAEVRSEIESRASIDAVGGCGWCGYPESHRGATGHPVHPRDWHALDVEEAVRAANGSPGANSAPHLVDPQSAPRPNVLPQPQRAPEPRPEVVRPVSPPVTPATPPLPRAPQRSSGMRRPPRVEQHDELLAQLRYDDAGECQWCGSPSEHRTEFGRVVHPAKFHRAEYEAERTLRDGGTAKA
ncbi:hypothetical protein [Actinomycetospora atypica]|uniref:Uncharacterized protein n=1 Tax=Actinomycetospora atypica TaxID=1290095 RepID=A0ABV9YT20_9PSEU